MSLTYSDLSLIRAIIGEALDDRLPGVEGELMAQRNDIKELYGASKRQNRRIEDVYVSLRATGRSAQQAFKLIEANRTDIKKLFGLVNNR